MSQVDAVLLEGTGYSLSESGRVSVRRFLEKLPPATVIEFAGIARSRFDDDNARVFKYFCGMCWRVIKEGG